MILLIVLIRNTIKSIEDMFRTELDFVYVVHQIRMSLYGFIYRTTLEMNVKNH